MAKIYVNNEDVKNINDGETIRFTKKYVKVQELLFDYTIFPDVIIDIVMDYINDIYIVHCIKPRWNTLSLAITQITLNDKMLLNIPTHYNYGMFLAYIGRSYIDISAEPNVCKIFNDTILSAAHEHNHTSLVNLFNYFMMKYYDRRNYITNTQDYMKNLVTGIVCAHVGGELVIPETTLGHDKCVFVSRKIHNYKELRNIIVIFKILCKIVVKMNAKN